MNSSYPILNPTETSGIPGTQLPFIKYDLTGGIFFSPKMNFALHHAKLKPTLLISTPHPISGMRRLKLDDSQIFYRDGSLSQLEQNYFDFKLAKNERDQEFWKNHNMKYYSGLQESKNKPEYQCNFLKKTQSEMMKYNKRHWHELITELRHGIPYEIALLRYKLYNHLFRERTRFGIWFIAGIVLPLYFFE